MPCIVGNMPFALSHSLLSIDGLWAFATITLAASRIAGAVVTMLSMPSSVVCRSRTLLLAAHGWRCPPHERLPLPFPNAHGPPLRPQTMLADGENIRKAVLVNPFARKFFGPNVCRHHVFSLASSPASRNTPATPPPAPASEDAPSIPSKPHRTAGPPQRGGMTAAGPGSDRRRAAGIRPTCAAQRRCRAARGRCAGCGRSVGRTAADFPWLVRPPSEWGTLRRTW